MTAVQNVASFIPAKFRAAIYTALGTLILLEGIWDVLPEPFEGKVLATLGALGFGVAAINASDRGAVLPPPAAPGLEEQFPGEFQ